MAEYWLLVLVELVTVAERVVSVGPKSLQSAEPSGGLIQVFGYTCHYLVIITILHWKLT